MKKNTKAPNPIENTPNNFDLTEFKKASRRMINDNQSNYNNYFDYESCLNLKRANTVEARRDLSAEYYSENGYYQQIILYYATLLRYDGVLIPQAGIGKNLSTPFIAKKYYSAMDYIDNANLAKVLTDCSKEVLVNGVYYGVVIENYKKQFCLLELPLRYCSCDFKDEFGNDLITFDLSYFDTIKDDTDRDAALEVYPAVISKAYKKYKKSSNSQKRRFVIPSDIGVVFSLFDRDPLLVNTIAAIDLYEDTINQENEKFKADIEKILIQKVPHLSDGRLMFEPDEAAELHSASVDMMKQNKQIRVLTTYCDVDVASTQGNNIGINNRLENAQKNIYAASGISSQVLSADGTSALKTSVENDLALMMFLANQYSAFISKIVDRVFGNSNIHFRYKILPISYYNSADYIDSTFKLASSGYSFLLPAIASGISQKDLIGMKDLENNLLGLQNILIPLKSSYTQNGEGSDEGGRPEKEDEDKADKTIEKEKSLK